MSSQIRQAARAGFKKGANINSRDDTANRHRRLAGEST